MTDPGRRHDVARPGPPPAIAIVLSLAGLLAVGVLDRVTGPSIDLSILYLLPVLLVTIITGRAAGTGFAVLAAIASGLFQIGAVESPLGELWNALTLLVLLAVVVHVVARLGEERERVEHLARTDPLTGLANLRSFRGTAARELARAERTGEPLTLVYIDIDDFKQVNDRFGHSGGDEVLQVTASGLRAASRAMDVPARLGGDEFAVLLPGTDHEDADAATRRLHDELTRAQRNAGWPVGFSVGAVTFTTPPGSVDRMLADADAEMYRVKRRHKRYREAV